MKTGQEATAFVPPPIRADPVKVVEKPKTPEPIKEEPEEIVNVLDPNMLQNLDN